MKAIYEPAGRGRNLSKLALNLFDGCTHGCTYCYVPAIRRKTRQEFHAKAEPRKGILDQIQKDVMKLAGDPREVLLSFTCDPYPANANTAVTREALKILGNAGMHATVLTKGGTRAERDFNLLEKYGFSFGTTLTCNRDVQLTRASSYRLEEQSKSGANYWEPGAASIIHRYAAIAEAHDRGIWTWVSLEPVIYPQQTLDIIRDLHNVVDTWKVGKWNHDKRANAIDWAKFLIDVRALLSDLGAEYMIKDDLLAFEEKGDLR